MIAEHDQVILTRDLPEYGLVLGDIATVVAIHQGGAGYTLEFITLEGETVAVLTLDASAVRPLGRREMAHARPLEGFA